MPVTVARIGQADNDEFTVLKRRLTFFYAVIATDGVRQGLRVVVG